MWIATSVTYLQTSSELINQLKAANVPPCHSLSGSADNSRICHLCLYLTLTKGDGRSETDANRQTDVSRGLHDFELPITNKNHGTLRLTLYHPETGKPFGGDYLGTANQMTAIKNWSLEYYLQD